MEAARLTAIIEAKDQGVAEKFRATDQAMAGLGQRAQDTAARAVRLTEMVGQQSRALDLARASLAATVERYGAASEAAERKRLAVDRLQTSLATNERRLEQTKEALARLANEQDRGAKGWAGWGEVATGALRRVGELGVEALGQAAAMVGDLTREAAAQYIAYENLEGATTSLVAAELTRADSALSMADAMAQAAPKAEELLRWQSELALNSPFSEEGIGQTFQQAQAYGFVSETASAADVDARRLTSAVIDYAAATRRGEDAAQGIALALGQIQAKGKLSAEELNQLAERGIDARGILSEALGVTTQEFVAMQEKGIIPAEQAIAVLVESLERDFGGAAATASDTFGGTLAKLEEVKNIGLREFFAGTAEAIGPLLKDIGDALGDPSVREGIRETGQAFGEWVRDVAEGAQVVFAATDRISTAVGGMVDQVGQSLARGTAGLNDGQREQLVGFLEGMRDGMLGAIPGANLFAGIDKAAEGVVALSGAQAAATPATQAQAAALSREAAYAGEAAEEYERLGTARANAAAPAGDAAAALRGALGERADAAAGDAATKDLEQAAARYQERLEDIARDGQIKRRDAAADHEGKVADIERDALRGGEDRARGHAEKLADLAGDGARARQEAEAQAAQDLASLETDGQRAREDLAREYEGRLAELSGEQARARADLIADGARAAEDAEADAARRREDVARDLARSLEDQERELAGKREDIGRDLQDKLGDLERKAQDDRAQAAERVAERLGQIDERAAEQRASLEEQLGQATDADDQAKIRKKIARLDEKTAAERGKIEAKAAADAADAEAAAARDRATAEEAAARKAADLERDAQAEREQAERGAARKLEDLARSQEEQRAARQADLERKLAELAEEQARELEAERAGYAAKQAELALDQERRRADLIAAREQKLAEIAADAAAALEAERAAYAAAEEEARLHLARKRADEQASYAERMADLQQAQADRRAAEGITAERAAQGDEPAAQGRAAQVQARLAAARAAADQAGQSAAGAGGTTIVNVAGSVLSENQLREIIQRQSRRTAGSGGYAV